MRFFVYCRSYFSCYSFFLFLSMFFQRGKDFFLFLPNFQCFIFSELSSFYFCFVSCYCSYCWLFTSFITFLLFSFLLVCFRLFSFVTFSLNLHNLFSNFCMKKLSFSAFKFYQETIIRTGTTCSKLSL